LSRLPWSVGLSGEATTATQWAQACSRGASRSSLVRWWPCASFCIFMHLPAFVRTFPYRGLRPGGDRLTRRHTVKKVKKTRIQEVPEFRGPGAASRFGRGLAGRAFGRFSAGGIVTRRSGGRKEENGKRGRRLQTSGSRLQKMRQAGMVHSLPEV